MIARLRKAERNTCRNGPDQWLATTEYSPPQDAIARLLHCSVRHALLASRSARRAAQQDEPPRRSGPAAPASPASLSSALDTHPKPAPQTCRPFGGAALHWQPPPSTPDEVGRQVPSTKRCNSFWTRIWPRRSPRARRSRRGFWCSRRPKSRSSRSMSARSTRRT